MQFDDFECFRMYCAVKAHFNSNYDYTKNKGLIKCNAFSFQKRNDKKLFKILVEMYPDKEICRWFLISNFLNNKNLHVSKLLSEDARDIFVNWTKKIKNIDEIFIKDINYLKNKHRNIFEISRNYPPNLIQEYHLSNINIESLVLLHKINNFFRYFDLKYSDNLLYSDLRFKVLKYDSILILSNKIISKCSEISCNV